MLRTFASTSHGTRKVETTPRIFCLQSYTFSPT